MRLYWRRRRPNAFFPCTLYGAAQGVRTIQTPASPTVAHYQPGAIRPNIAQRERHSARFPSLAPVGSGNIPVEADQKYGVDSVRCRGVPDHLTLRVDVICRAEVPTQWLELGHRARGPPDDRTVASIDRGTGNLDLTHKIAALIRPVHPTRTCIELLDLPLAVDEHPAHRHPG